MTTNEIGVLWALIGGLLSFISPCVLPLVPSYISFITGISFEELTNQENEREIKKVILVNSIMFIIGFSVVFISLGASASFFGQFFITYKDIIRKIGGIIIILLGVHIIGLINFRILQQDKRLHFFREKPAGLLGSFLVGIGFAAGWTPCIGPILASILIIAAGSETFMFGMFLMVIYSIGLAIPFLFTSFGINAFLKHFSRLKKHMRLVSIITGSFLIVIGLLIYTNYFAIISGMLNSLLPFLNF
ncbi:MAG: sulfite exporter TauE/SafE family protein [Deltaproteobacteria bacterium]|nr:sulfite exporter TauE/SafE family protein [Deltaproteobacteria bacterium]